MDKIKAELALTEAQAEHEAAAVQSDDVVNAASCRATPSYVVVQVVYDDLARATTTTASSHADHASSSRRSRSR
jgi:hypothetical protein